MSRMRWGVSLGAVAVIAVVSSIWLLGEGGDPEELETVVLPTSTTGPSPGPTVSRAPGSAPTSSPPSPSDRAQGAIFVTFDGTIIGWFEGGGWVAPDATGTEAPPVAGASLRSLDGSTTVVAGDPLVACLPESSHGKWYLDDERLAGLNVSGAHELQPRAVRTRQATAADRASVQEALNDLDVDADAVVRRVHVVDLEGDGKDEAIIVASNVEDGVFLHGLSDDHYSLVLLRRLRPDDSVEVVTVHAERAPGPDGTANSITVEDVEAIADLDGDGGYEVVMSYFGYEWGGTTVRDLTTPAPTDLIRVGCGV